MTIPCGSFPRMVESASRSRRNSINAAVLLVLLLIAAIAVGLVASPRGSRAIQQLEAGKRLMSMGRAPDAERAWLDAVQRDPESAEAWALLAGYYEQAGDETQAYDALRHLVRIRPGSPEALDRLAASAARVGEPAKILRESEDSIRSDPQDVGALAVAIKLLARSDDEQKRLGYLRQMAGLRPDDVNYLVQLARMLTNLHLYDEAAPLTEQILKLDANNVDGYGLRGRRLLDTGASPTDLERAESDFRKALQLNPRGPMIHLQLGKLYMRRDQPAKAVVHLEIAADLMPDQPEILYVLSTAYAQAGQRKLADRTQEHFARVRQATDRLNSLEKRCAADPGDFELHLHTGALALRSGDQEKADYYLHRASEINPVDLRVRSALRELSSFSEVTSVPDSGGRP